MICNLIKKDSLLNYKFNYLLSQKELNLFIHVEQNILTTILQIKKKKILSDFLNFILLKKKIEYRMLFFYQSSQYYFFNHESVRTVGGVNFLAYRS